MKKHYFKLLLLSAMLNYSCSKYLDVQPKSSIGEEQMFASEIGFEQALVGVYSQLGKQELYGDRLSLGLVSALAQNYTQTGSSAPYIQTSKYNYQSDEVRKYLLQVWSSGYNAIAGLNKIIDKTETNRDVLSENSYSLIRGEALALRAYIHFDLFRLFGPIYQDEKEAKALPYETQVDAFANIPSSSTVYCEKVLADVAEAARLLKDSEPLLIVNGDLNKRRIKMNYYAIKGLEARVNMYIGEKAGAFAAAQEVVDGAKFPFVVNSTVNANASAKDRLFVPELVFSLRSTNILTWTENYFKFFRSSSNALTRSIGNINTIYESTTTDIRRLYLFEQDQNILFPSKFWQTYTPTVDEGLTSPRRKDQLIPMIRISEMYYIMAEAAATPEEGVIHLNKVRFARALNKLPEGQPITAAFLDAEIRKEYYKEFYGEGQYFFYLKRKKVTRMPFMNADVPLTIYKLPIPDVELEYNPTYQ